MALAVPTHLRNLKSRQLLGDERPYVEEALGSAAHQRLHTCGGRFSQELTTLLLELS